MPPDYSRIYPYLIAVIAVFLVYRRLRRSFGRQRISSTRMGLRIGILVLLGVSMLPAALRSGQFMMAEVIGIVAGAALGLWGAQRTRYQMHEERLHYVPHTYTGIAVSLLFVGRLVYRFVAVSSMNRVMESNDAPMQDFGASTMVRSPFTVGLLFVVVGYYVCYYSLVLWKSHRISPEDLEVDSTSTGAPTST
jgi:hypothetical protein